MAYTITPSTGTSYTVEDGTINNASYFKLAERMLLTMDKFLTKQFKAFRKLCKNHSTNIQ